MANQFLKNLFICFIVLGAFLPTFGQVDVPNLTCVATQGNSNNLTWELPSACASFSGYLIYGATSLSGTYTLITTISNPTTTTFEHINASASTTDWFYFMQQDCAGTLSINSDTLDDAPPITPELDLVTLENGNAELFWNASPSPETQGYIVFYESPSGSNNYVILDTVYNTLTYNDVAALGNQNPERYSIAAIDICGNTGVFQPLAHATVFLNGGQDTCSGEVSLNWTSYENWTAGILRHEVWLSINGGALQLLTSLDPGITSYIYPDGVNGESLCFEVRSVNAGNPNKVSVSNDFCIVKQGIRLVDQLTIENISFTDDNTYSVSFKWDGDADYQGGVGLNGERLNNLAPFSTVTDFVSIDQSFDMIPYMGTRNYYQIQATDVCSAITESNVGRPLVLNGKTGEQLTNLLSWEPFDIEYGTVLSYTIFRRVGGNSTFLANVSSNTFSLEDQISPYIEEEGNTCYYLVANARMDFPTGHSTLIESQSNTICLEHDAFIQVPNAFAPNGQNSIFKPLIVFGANKSYSFAIFSRWGTEVFRTSDVNQGWDGRYKGKQAQQGVYVYRIMITQADGSVIEKKGSLLLLQ